MANIRPFQFTGLPRLTREEADIHASLSQYLSQRPFEPRFAESLAGELEQVLKVPCNFSDFKLRPVGRADLHQVLPAVSCILVIGAAPIEHKILVELDPALASYAIDRLLGGKGDAPRIQRPLTEIEQGVLSYLLLRVLGQFHQGWRTGQELALTLDDFASKPDELTQITDEVPGYHMLGVNVAFGKRIGYARILLPEGLIDQTLASAIPQGGASAGDLTHMRRVLDGLGDVAIWARAEGANIDLAPDELAALEPGDIILLENHQLQKTDTGVEGYVLVRLGRGENGGLRAYVSDNGESVQLQIAEIVQQEEPQEAQMADGGEPEDMGEEPGMQDEGMQSGEPAAPPPAEDNLAETEGLLRDVPAPVVVELGRIRMNTSQVVRLRSGQILRLPRAPSDPVDLVVNGKVFAKGELIEVDGELGVRLIQVVGQD